MTQTQQPLTQEIFYSVDQIQQHHEQKRSISSSFFSRVNMKAFKTRVLQDVYQGAGGVFFVVSNQFTGSNGTSEPRYHEVQQYNPETGSIWSPANPERVSGEKLSKAEAIKEAQSFAAGTIKRLGSE